MGFLQLAENTQKELDLLVLKSAFKPENIMT